MSGTHAGGALAHHGWLARWDARARIVALVALSFATALTSQLATATAGALAALAIALAGRVSLLDVARRLRLLALFLVPIGIFVPFHDAPGARPLFAAWPRGPTDAGFDLALLVAVRIAGASIAALLAVGASPFDRTAKALQDLGVPRRLVHMALLAYRYTFIFGDDLARVRAALASRGFRPRADRRTIATYGSVVGGLLVRSVDRTERLDLAMRCRGFDGRLRTLGGARLRARDVALALAIVALGAAIAAADVGVRLGWWTA